jgi:hypothetical protein
MVAQASACGLGSKLQKRTGVGPLFWCRRQTSPNRIVLDIHFHLFELLRMADPVVKGFVLPEGHSHTSQNRICLTCGPSLDGSGDLCQIDRWGDQDVYVIRHDYKGTQLIEAIRVFPDAVYHASCDFSPTEPRGHSSGSIQQLILFRKRAAVRKALVESGERASQTPGDKDRRAGRMPVREVSPVHSGNE